MRIVLEVRKQGHVPSFKNNKRTIQRPDGRLMPVTEKETKKWMSQCIRSFELQLLCATQISAGATLTAPLPRSLIASSLPLDDSRQWIPELHILSQDVDAGMEGAEIIIEPIP